MKSFIFLLSMISLAQLISSKTPQEEKLSETIKALEGHLLYYYIHEKKTQVNDILTQIQSLDENVYKRDRELIGYWEYIDDTMPLNPRVAPDGLPQTTDHAFVVLGYALNSDGSLRAEAKGRCDVAYESAMTETKAKDTIQNAKYTMEKLIEYNIKSITVITSDYHIRRGSILFKGEAMVKAESLGITAIQVLENAVYPTSKSTEGKTMEGYALAAILNVTIKLGMLLKTLPKIVLEGLRHIMNDYLLE